MRAAKRSWSFEESLRVGKGSGWARTCFEEVEKREITGEGRSKWEKERRKFMEEREIRQSVVRGEGREQIWEKNERKKGNKEKKGKRV